MGGNLVETLIGAVVLAVAGVFLVFAYNRADIGSVDGYELTAKFQKIDGIRVGSDVLMSGIKVGAVTGQQLDPQNYLAVVRFTVREDIEVPEDSALKVASSGLLGDKYLALEPGGADAKLRPGGEVQFTQGSVDLMDLIGKAIYSTGSGAGGPPPPKGDGS
jgi:phospholipid/cholesterol/gamma-HCH transport system substrate-binding protein